MIAVVTRLLCFLAALLVATPGLAAPGPARPVPRVVLALYDGEQEPEVRFSMIHTRVELPLNHLGIVVHYHDLRRGLPSDDELDGVRGVVTWLFGDAMRDAKQYVDWVARLIDSGRRFVVFGRVGVEQALLRGELSAVDVERLWSRLGLRSSGEWVKVTYDVEIVRQNPFAIAFERPLGGRLPGYPVVEMIDPRAKSHLRVHRPEVPGSTSDLVVSGPGGGYVADGYALYVEEPDLVQWLIDPFEFLRFAFDTDGLPKPDYTTVSGRRIFYSHIDGDGWRNVSEIEKYRKRKTLSSEVILREILEPMPDLPVTVAPVAGDLDSAWYGSEATRRIAREVFALPHVEIGSHTYGHPLDWGYFAEEGSATKTTAAEPAKVSHAGLWGRLTRWFASERDDPVFADGTAYEGAYERPRSYSVEPFSLRLEIDRSVHLLQGLAPEGKTVRLYQWSGDTAPFPEAIAATRAFGLRNINGGDSRFDQEFPSYAWLAPVGLEHDGQRQIYASNSNENTYTDLWTGRYFGFIYLRNTLENTEIPRRIKPFNVYYHMYSGEKLASLYALRENLRLARLQQLAPIRASEYAAIADGFFSTRFQAIGSDCFRVLERDGVTTIRFDHATFQAVDWARSRGVIGQRHHQGSLYIALDPEVPAPVIALADHPRSGSLAVADRPYLIEGRWRIRRLRSDARGFRFVAQGFGSGEMSWKVPWTSPVDVVVSRDGRVLDRRREEADSEGVLRLSLAVDAIEPVAISVSREVAR